MHLSLTKAILCLFCFLFFVLLFLYHVLHTKKLKTILMYYKKLKKEKGKEIKFDFFFFGSFSFGF